MLRRNVPWVNLQRCNTTNLYLNLNNYGMTRKKARVCGFFFFFAVPRTVLYILNMTCYRTFYRSVLESIDKPSHAEANVLCKVLGGQFL